MKRLVLTFAAFAMACGGDDAGEESSTNADTATLDSSSGASDPTTVTAAESSTGPSDGSTGATLTADGSSSDGSEATATDTGSSEDGSSSVDGSTGEPSALVVEISAAQSFMDCMPIVAPDPSNLSFTLDFDNQGAAVTSANVTVARFATGGAEVATFEISPDSFGPFDAGEMSSVPAMKVDGSLFPSNGCDSLDCGADYDLEIEFDVDGATALATGTVTVECAF